MNEWRIQWRTTKEVGGHVLYEVRGNLDSISKIYGFLTRNDEGCIDPKSIKLEEVKK